MTSFVASHFVNRIVDSIKVELLRTLSDTRLVFASTTFSVHTLLKVGLRIPNYVTEQFSELSCVFSFFPSITLESLSDFGITFAVSLTAHSEIHTNFRAFTVEVSVEILDHFIVATLSYTYFVFSYKSQRSRLVEFLELRSGNATLGALFGCMFAFMYITTYGADKFLFHCELSLDCYELIDSRLIKRDSNQQASKFFL
ncbi:membrane protein [gut metagenome]|uniref:Membrane protein n=1 Tax=gut metagenome TaxID=749906 RepID=J9C584_9ZZZZ